MYSSTGWLAGWTIFDAFLGPWPIYLDTCYGTPWECQLIYTATTVTALVRPLAGWEPDTCYTPSPCPASNPVPILYPGLISAYRNGDSTTYYTPQLRFYTCP